MIARSWFIYDLATGLFTGESLTAKDAEVISLALRKRPGRGAKEGNFDARRQRVDLSSGEVIYCPKVTSASEANERREAALQTLRALEAKQHRRVRELLATSDPQLQELEAKIAEQRAILNGETETNAPEDSPR
jgi:hypothetical protein